MIIEDHYKRSMDLEWAKDGISGELYILQARPETVHQQAKFATISSYKLKSHGPFLTKGLAIGNQITCGVARILSSPAEIEKLNVGEILVTEYTSPDWDPILKKVSGIITNKGGRTSHAAIIARELGAVAIVGAEDGTSTIHDGDLITLSCAEGRTGYLYMGKLEWEKNTIDTSSIVLPDYPKAQLIIADPDQAFKLSFLPNHGVGLLRMEFMISNYIQVHPMALLHPEQVTDKIDQLKIGELTRHYKNPEDFFVDKLAEGIGLIAAAFAPKEVIVRMSDFKTNEYAGLIGGQAFEPKEENPMIGFRGASRYYHDRYKEAFELECKAICIVRDHIGLTNVKVMIPFCRTVEEGKKVIALMEEFGLKRGQNGLEIFVMAELPANVILAAQFAEVFDGFSIGSNDLTQLTLGVDRDSVLVAELFNEENAAMEQLIKTMISKAKESGKHCGLCGQAASDSILFAKWLVESGIDSIAFNADALIKGIDQINIVIRDKTIEVIGK
jgi:pyruvate,water dikinase